MATDENRFETINDVENDFISLLEQGHLKCLEGKYLRSQQLLNEALKAASNEIERIIVLNEVSVTYLRMGDIESAFTLFQEILELSNKANFRHGVFLAKFGLGEVMDQLFSFTPDFDFKEIPFPVYIDTQGLQTGELVCEECGGIVIQTLSDHVCSECGVVRSRRYVVQVFSYIEDEDYYYEGSFIGRPDSEYLRDSSEKRLSAVVEENFLRMKRMSDLYVFPKERKNRSYRIFRALARTLKLTDSDMAKNASFFLKIHFIIPPELRTIDVVLCSMMFTLKKFTIDELVDAAEISGYSTSEERIEKTMELIEDILEK